MATWSATGRTPGPGRADLGFEFGRVESTAGGSPVTGSQLEEALAGPGREDADEVAEVGLGIKSMEASRGDEAEQIAGGLGVVIAADEEPRLPSDRMLT